MTKIQITIGLEDLIDCIQFKKKSVERALNLGKIEAIKTVQRQIIRDLDKAISSIEVLPDTPALKPK